MRKIFLSLMALYAGFNTNAAIIRNEAAPKANQWICFRKHITVNNSNPSDNQLRIAADSKYWLWVNGELEVFEGALKRGPNANDSYVDVTQLKHLKQGDNTIAVLVWHYGKEGFAHKNSGCPGLDFNLTVGDETFESNATWLTSLHPAYYTPNGETPNWRLAESNIGFNAQKDINQWTETNFDDSDWKAASEVTSTDSNWGKYVDRPIPFWKDYGVKDYVSQKKNGNKIVCKLPYNAQVTPILTVKAPAGRVIGIQTDDYKPTGENSLRAEYITKEGLQTYESLGWINGHEVIYNIPSDVEVVSLTYRETGYDCDFSGSYNCDTPDLNRLWEMSQRTLYITMRDNFMDCPDRERAQWIGDFAIELEEIYYSLSTSANLLSAKCLHEFANWQHENGTLHAPVPEGNYDTELPQQCLAAMGWGAWHYYMGTGDKQTIQDVFPAWKKYMHIWQMDSNGLVVYRQGGWDWGDWGSNQDMQALCQFWYAVALEYYARQADLLGQTEEAAWARNRNEGLKTAIHTQLWNGEAYRFPSYTGATDDRTQAMAVISGVAPQSEYPQIRKMLVNIQYASPYMERFVLEALCQMGYVEDALNRLHSRYQPMIDAPYTTLWELFTLNGGTYNHAWSGAPLIIMSKYITGVQLLQPGFSKFLVRPQLCTLKNAETTIPTAYGNIVVKARKDAGLTFDVDVPEGTTAVLSVSTDYAQITLNGEEADFTTTDDGKYQEKEVGAGHYTVKALGMDNTRPLITSTSQLSSSGHHENFTTDYLIDGDINTYFHANVLGWYTPDWSTYDSYIQVELNNPVSSFFLKTNRRYESGSNDVDNNCVPPKELEVWVSNDKENWTKTTTLAPLPATADKWPYVSPLIQLQGEYKYVRYYCRGVYGPNFSYWCLSELQMYPVVDETTYYLNQAINEAEALLPLAFDKEALIYEADDEDDAHNQFSSNARWTYKDAASGGQGSYGALIDNNDQTYFHSAYPNAPKEYSYLQVDLKRNDVNAFTLEMLRRGDGGWNDAWNQMPTNIDIYATNDESAATAQTNNEAWTLITNLSSGFPGASSHNKYVSPLIEMNNDYRYLRFVVKATAYGGNNDAGYPFFNMSEFQLFNNLPAKTSEYYTIDGMKEAYEQLNNLVKSVKEKMANGIIEPNDTTELYNAIRQMKEVYVDREAIETALSAKILEAQTALQQAFCYDDLITQTSQIISSGTSSNLKKYLIDNDSTTVYTLSNSMALNQGKTFFTINLLRTDIDKVILTFQAAAGDNRATPSAIDIYGSSSTTSFKRLASLTKGFPEDEDYAVYTSPILSFDKAYKYIRIVPVDAMGIVNPMAFTLAELQLKNGTPNEEESKYFKYDNLKNAVDELTDLTATMQEKVNTKMATDRTDVTLLNDKILALKQLIKDIEGQEAVGITPVQTPAQDDCWYDLSGHKVTNPQKGIFIKKGQKRVF